MLFNDLNFLILFLPAVTITTWWLVPDQFRIQVLIIASFIFYGMSGWEHALLLLMSTLWVYLFTHGLLAIGSRCRLVLAIAFPVAALVYLKYTNFILYDVLSLESSGDEGAFSLFRDVVLPAGISFFTFQLIGYAIDRYRGSVKEPPTLKAMLLYISFFPQLIAGPIVRLAQVSSAIENLPSFRPKRQNIADAFGFIAIGLSYKVLIADSLHHGLKPMLEKPEEIGLIGFAYLIPAYSFQIYFDFYGYSLIAIGLGKLFGFSLPINFRAPYSALNPKDFWRRWHITLSYWIRDYLYLPLRGNKNYKRNILIVFGVCGLWHGAGFSFIVWGLFHGLFVILYNQNVKAWDALPRFLQWMMTFSLVSVSWLLFVFEVQDLSTAFASMVRGGYAEGFDITYEMLLIIAVAALVCFRIKAEKLATIDFSKPLMSFAWGGVLGAAFFMSLMFVDRSEAFIYFRF